MKIEKVTYLTVLLLLSLCLLGCRNKNQPDIQGEIIIMKFKQPEYKSCILANYESKKDSLYVYAFNRCEEPIGFTEDSPYWELPNNWLLVDWKWFYLPYDEKGLFVLTERTWKELYPPIGRYAVYPLTEPHVPEPVEQVCYIKTEKLEKYAKSPYGTAEKKWITDTHTINSTTDKELCMCERKDTMDSIWTILQRDLSVAIENGDLGKITK